MASDTSSFKILSRYVFHEFLLSFIVAFFFFFFIFFINQLLLLAQKILLKNIDIPSVFRLVSLAIPQILLYTLPFSSLTAASMVIGNLSSGNEILALRSCGISLRHVFMPIILVSLLLSGITYSVADILLPYSSQRYKTLYSELLQKLPTMELESYSVNKIGDKILVTGEVDDDGIHDIVLFDVSKNTSSQVISASSGTMDLIDLQHMLYRLDLKDPVMLGTDGRLSDDFSLADAESMSYYLDFSDEVTRFTDISPSQMSSRDLLDAIEIRKNDVDSESASRISRTTVLRTELADTLRSLEYSSSPIKQLVQVSELSEELDSITRQRSVNFYLQYYRAELHKKMALSAACFFLVFITFPLSFFKIKYGRLFGFGLSLFVACFYWFMLFFAQTKILDIPFNPGFLIWAPDAIVFFAAGALLLKLRHL
ncbi:MAG: LptF/LptG family permease [Sphaerochaetaceae bacterium]